MTVILKAVDVSSLVHHIPRNRVMPTLFLLLISFSTSVWHGWSDHSWASSNADFIVFFILSQQKELIREVEMGPFKHTVDDGLDIRKVSLHCGSVYSVSYLILQRDKNG